MARMIPFPIPEHVEVDEGRWAECAVYEALRIGLTDDYRVYFSVAWLARPAGGKPQDGEADFVIVHPDRGLLVLEVKGGSIGRDGVSGRWTSTNRYGRRYEIRNPVEQARTSRFALRDKLDMTPAWHHRPITMGHGVVFPDCEALPPPFPPEMPSEIALFSPDLEQLETAIPGLYRYWTEPGVPAARLDREALQVLDRLFSRHFELRRPLEVDLRKDEHRIDRLTAEQCETLDCLSRLRRMAVSGGAGTGKTVLAVETARRLAGEGFRTLLTCFNLPLAGFLKSAAASGASSSASVSAAAGAAASPHSLENLTVLNFHELCRHLATKAGISLPECPPDRQPPQEYYDRTLPEALDAALRRLPENRFDAIVVDEGQDFREEWWLLLQMALADPDHGILYVFHDDNQAIYPRPGGIPADLSPVVLSRNLRNTRAIFGVARRFYGGKRVMAVGPTGRPVEFVTATGPAEVEKAVSRLLHRIIREEGVPPRDVALLTGRARDKSAFGGLAMVGAYGLTPDQRREPDHVLFETVFRFKGLERPVVILVELDERREREEVLYVGLTRARSYLAVVGEEPTLELLRQRDEAG